jgi:peptidoglycan-associated lipoprotein
MTQRPLTRIAIFSIAAASLATAMACSEKKPKEETPPTSSRDFSEGRSQAPENVGPQRSPDLNTVYFDFDRSDIRSDQQPVLRGNAAAIQKHTDWKLITIEGNCDERGTEEYNLALGDRRANAAKTYLENLGISATKLTTVSLGASQPAVAGHDEAAWAKNRRDEFLYSK